MWRAAVAAADAAVKAAKASAAQSHTATQQEETQHDVSEQMEPATEAAPCAGAGAGAGAGSGSGIGTSAEVEHGEGQEADISGPPTTPAAAATRRGADVSPATAASADSVAVTPLRTPLSSCESPPTTSFGALLSQSNPRRRKRNSDSCDSTLSATSSDSAAATPRTPRRVPHPSGMVANDDAAEGAAEGASATMEVSPLRQLLPSACEHLGGITSFAAVSLMLCRDQPQFVATHPGIEPALLKQFQAASCASK